MKPYHIKIPYWSAGVKYNWTGKPVGIGIDMKKLVGDGSFAITVGDDKTILEIDKSVAREFIDKHNSFYIARGVKLGVIALYMFHPPENINQKILL